MIGFERGKIVSCVRLSMTIHGSVMLFALVRPDYLFRLVATVSTGFRTLTNILRRFIICTREENRRPSFKDDSSSIFFSHTLAPFPNPNVRHTFLFSVSGRPCPSQRATFFITHTREILKQEGLELNHKKPTYCTHCNKTQDLPFSLDLCPK